MPKSSRLMDCSATLTPASISTARAVSSKPRTTPAETGECKISKPAWPTIPLRVAGTGRFRTNPRRHSMGGHVNHLCTRSRDRRVRHNSGDSCASNGRHRLPRQAIHQATWSIAIERATDTALVHVPNRKRQRSPAMGHMSSLRCMGLLIRGFLVSLCVFAVPELASSEADAPSDRATGFQAGRYEFVSTGPFLYSALAKGFRVTLTSTTYGHDPAASAYATIRATPAHPVVIQEIDGVVSVDRH